MRQIIFKIGAKSLIRQADVIGRLVNKGMYFFDYGNAFLLEASRAKADVCNEDGSFKYPSYVEDIMGPLCFDYGFGPFRWVCSSQSNEDLKITDLLAAKVLKKRLKTAPKEIKQQIKDNLQWILSAEENQLVVGSKARILYADSAARIDIAKAFHRAIKQGKIKAPLF